MIVCHNVGERLLLWTFISDDIILGMEHLILGNMFDIVKIVDYSIILIITILFQDIFGYSNELKYTNG